MKPMMILTLLFCFASCNVVQMLKQAETKVPDDFFKGYHKGPEDQLIFFQSNMNAYYFDTRSESLVLMGEVDSAAIGDSYYPYRGDIYFASGSHWFRYDFNSLTSNETTFLVENFQEYQGHLFFHSYYGMQVIPYGTTEPVAFNETDDTTAINSIQWIHADHQYGLFACAFSNMEDNSELKLHQLEVNYGGDELTYTAINLNTECNLGLAYGANGYIVYENDSDLYRYDIVQNNSSIFSTNASILSMDYDGKVILFKQPDSLVSYPNETDTTVTTQGIIQSFNIFTGPFVSDFEPDTIYQQENLYQPANVLSPPDGRYFFNKEDANSIDQLYELMPGGTLRQLTFFENGTTIHYFHYGHRGIYLFTSKGIYLLEFDKNFGFTKEAILVNNFSSQSWGHKAISLGEIFHHN